VVFVSINYKFINFNYFIIYKVFDFLISNCWRDFGNRSKVSQDPLFYLGILFGIVNGSSRFLWGFLMDKFGFRILMFVITGIEILISTTLYFSVNNVFLYIISVLFISACIGGHFSILSPEFNKIFGFEKGPEMYGLTGIFIGIASICGPLLANFLLETKEDFFKVFLIGGILCLDKFIVLFCFDENEPFRLNTKIKNNNLIKAEKIESSDIDKIELNESESIDAKSENKNNFKTYSNKNVSEN